MLAAWKNLRDDFGISGTTGVSGSSLAPIESTGPSNIIFNFADAGAGGPSARTGFQWMARRYGLPLYELVGESRRRRRSTRCGGTASLSGRSSTAGYGLSRRAGTASNKRW